MVTATKQKVLGQVHLGYSHKAESPRPRTSILGTAALQKVQAKYFLGTAALPKVQAKDILGTAALQEVQRSVRGNSCLEEVNYPLGTTALQKILGHVLLVYSRTAEIHGVRQKNLFTGGQVPLGCRRTVKGQTLCQGKLLSRGGQVPLRYSRTAESPRPSTY